MKKKIILIFLWFFIWFYLEKDNYGNKIDDKTGSTPLFFNKAIEFSLPDLSDNLVSLSDFKDQVILLTFWTSRCPYCLREVPILKEIYKEYAEKVKIISIVIGEDKESIKRFKEREKIPYLILLDREGEVSRLYKVLGVPTDIIIDRERNIRYYNFYWPKNLKEIIETLL